MDILMEEPEVVQSVLEGSPSMPEVHMDAIHPYSMVEGPDLSRRIIQEEMKGKLLQLSHSGRSILIIYIDEKEQVAILEAQSQASMEETNCWMEEIGDPVRPEQLEGAIENMRLRHYAEALREDARRSTNTAYRLEKIVQKQEDAMTQMDKLISKVRRRIGGLQEDE
jgi:hypothetical protein